jgi:hypothetical protein
MPVERSGPLLVGVARAASVLMPQAPPLQGLAYLRRLGTLAVGRSDAIPCQGNDGRRSEPRPTDPSPADYIDPRDVVFPAVFMGFSLLRQRRCEDLLDACHGCRSFRDRALLLRRPKGYALNAQILGSKGHGSRRIEWLCHRRDNLVRLEGVARVSGEHNTGKTHRQEQPLHGTRPNGAPQVRSRPESFKHARCLSLRKR